MLACGVATRMKNVDQNVWRVVVLSARGSAPGFTASLLLPYRLNRYYTKEEYSW